MEGSATVRTVEIEDGVGLEDYGGQAHLVPVVRALEAGAAAAAPLLRGRRVWMLNSTAKGGGVAEMLPKLVRLLRDLGIPTEWLVLETRRPEFFELTKRIHNLIHGVGDPRFGPAARDLYEAVSREAAAALAARVAPGDVLIVHDPQPLGAGAILRREVPVIGVWRCHIGLDERPPAVLAAWEFLQPYATAYDHTVFTASEYIPDYLAGRASIICPGIDPASHKNRDLPVNKLFGILCNSGLAPEAQPVLTPPWERPALRLRPDGSFVPAGQDEIGLGYRPVVLQVSRWDRLKGWGPLLEAFARLKLRHAAGPATEDPRHRRRLELVRLVLAGPDPDSIQDDPEARDVLSGMAARYQALPPALQRDVALLTLPMASPKENALMVNVLQRCAVVVVQNSLREGFGLTVTEAMWKRVAVLGSRACGIRLQIRDGLEGRLTPDAEDPDGLADRLDAVLADARSRELWRVRAQRRVYDEFLVFTQVRRWIELMAALVERRAGPGAGSSRPSADIPRRSP